MSKKNITLLFLLAFVAFFSCKKNNSTPGPIGTLAISSWVPKVPYFGDELTIKGTGFNPDPTKNEVLFEGSVNATIVSASATELKVIVPDISSTLTPGYYSYIIVRTDGNEVVANDPINFARPVKVIGFTGSTNGTIYPGDSLVIEGSGFARSAGINVLHVLSNLTNNTTEYGAITPIWVDSSFYSNMHCFYKAGNCVGGDSNTPDTATIVAYVQVNVNGHTDAKIARIAKFPRMQVAYVNHSAALINTFRVVTLRYLSILPGTVITMDGPVKRTYQFDQGYRDSIEEKSLQFVGGDLPAGTYTMSVLRNNVLYLSEIIGFN